LGNGVLFSQQSTGELNAIQTVVPFLTIAPDSRAGGMGDAGVATSPDVYSMHWNPAKFAFIDGDHGYDAVCKDIENVERYLVPGAWICFDDAFSSYEGVSRAIQDMIINNPEYSFGQQMTRKFFVARKK